MQAFTRNILAVGTLSALLVACGGGGSTGASSSIATITFDNGETLSTSVLCVLEPQTAAGQEILYTATSTSSPYFDVTVFGPNSMFKGAKISWNETVDFETSQENWASTPGVGGMTPTVEATLNGKTITGSGTLIRGLDSANKEGEKRKANIVVECDG